MDGSVLEREYQFDMPDPAAAERWLACPPPLPGLKLRALPERTQRDTYLDTEDWAMFRGGYALRIRHDEAGGEVTLKALTRQVSGVQQRREITQSPADADGGVVERVRLLSGGRAPRALFEIETRRRNVLVQRDEETLAVVSLDESAVACQGRVPVHLHRLEIEEASKDGLDSLEPFVAEFVSACGLKPAAMSKFEAGLEAAGLSPAASLDFGDTELSPDAGAGTYGLALLRRNFADFLRHEPGTRLGEDAEQLHDMRVAVRRLRAVMSLLSVALPLGFRRLNEELRWFDDVLSPVRDLDVHIDWLRREQPDGDEQDHCTLQPLLDRLRRSRDAARAELLATMNGARYGALVEALTSALKGTEAGEGQTPQRPARAFLREKLRRRFRKLRRTAAALSPESDATSLHRVRVLTRKLRFAVEAMEPLAPKRARKLAGATRAGQDLLGEHHDCVVAIERLHGLVEERGDIFPPATLVRIGELIEKRRQSLRDVPAAWPRVQAEIERRWRAFDKALRNHD